MAQGCYVATFDNVSVTAATDLFYGTVAADRPVTLYQMTLCQTSDLGDLSEEVLRIGLYRGASGGTGGAASAEPGYTDADLQAATCQVLTNNTSASTGGTLLEPIGWNIRVPLLWCPIPELRPRIDSTEDPFAVRLIGAPADAITVSGALWWAEG
jgi:hypothetical protein